MNTGIYFHLAPILKSLKLVKRLDENDSQWLLEFTNWIISDCVIFSSKADLIINIERRK